MQYRVVGKIMRFLRPRTAPCAAPPAPPSPVLAVTQARRRWDARNSGRCACCSGDASAESHRAGKLWYPNNFTFKQIFWIFIYVFYRYPIFVHIRSYRKRVDLTLCEIFFWFLRQFHNLQKHLDEPFSFNFTWRKWLYCLNKTLASANQNC